MIEYQFGEIYVSIEEVEDNHFSGLQIANNGTWLHVINKGCINEDFEGTQEEFFENLAYLYQAKEDNDLEAMNKYRANISLESVNNI